MRCCAGRFLHHGACGAYGLGGGGDRAPFFLDAEGHNRLVGEFLKLLAQCPMADRFTAKSDDDHPIDVWIERKSRQNALSEFGVGGHVRAADIDDDVFCTLDL